MSNKTIRTVLAAIAVFLFSSQLQAVDEQVHVVPASDLNQWWQAAPGGKPRPQYEPPASAATGCVVAAFEIHGDGSVSNQRVLRSVWTDADVGHLAGKAVLRALRHSRFVATAANAGHEPVYTYQVFTFTVSLGTESDADLRRKNQQLNEALSKCDIPDFPQQVQAMINSKKAGGQP